MGISRKDPGVFANWLAHCEEPLRISIRRYARFVDVEAVVQETALRVWQLAPQIKPDDRPNWLLRWAVTVARNLARDEARRTGREVALDDGDNPGRLPVTTEVDPILRKRIQTCRDKLPRKPATALAARLGNAGATPDQRLAKTVGMTYDAFRQNLTRARRLLEECLRQYGVEVRSLL